MYDHRVAQSWKGDCSEFATKLLSSHFLFIALSYNALRPVYGSLLTATAQLWLQVALVVIKWVWLKPLGTPLDRHYDQPRWKFEALIIEPGTITALSL